MTDIIVIVGSCFLLYHLENGGGLFEIGRPSSRGGRILDLVGQAGGGGGAKILQTSWTSYMYRPLAKLNLREDYVSLTLIIQKSKKLAYLTRTNYVNIKYIQNI